MDQNQQYQVQESQILQSQIQQSQIQQSQIQEYPIRVIRTYQERINKNHPLYNIFNELTIKSVKLYNSALYQERQWFFQHKRLISSDDLSTLLNYTPEFQALPSKIAQNVIRQVATAMKVFKSSSKDYKEDPKKYTGKPRIPQYKKDENYPNKIYKNLVILDYQQLRMKNNQILLPKKLGSIGIPKQLSGIQIKKDGIQSNFQITQLRIVPKQSEFNIEYVYEKVINITRITSTTNTKVASIDLGVDNLIALVISDPRIPGLLINGKGLKSYNQNFNRKLSKLQSSLQNFQNNNKNSTNKNRIYKTKRIEKLYLKRSDYINTYMHKVSRLIINHLQKYQVSKLIVGHNNFKKQKITLGHKNNQIIVQISYNKLIDKLKYKCEEVGIDFETTEESYTSGTSFLDNEYPSKEFYNKSRRKHRGLFITNTGIKINADINAAYQILRKESKHGLKLDQQTINLIAHQTPIKINIA